MRHTKTLQEYLQRRLDAASKAKTAFSMAQQHYEDALQSCHNSQELASLLVRQAGDLIEKGTEFAQACDGCDRCEKYAREEFAPDRVLHALRSDDKEHFPRLMIRMTSGLTREYTDLHGVLRAAVLSFDLDSRN
jgi:hypothetical protein